MAILKVIIVGSDLIYQKHYLINCCYFQHLYPLFKF